MRLYCECDCYMNLMTSIEFCLENLISSYWCDYNWTLAAHSENWTHGKNSILNESIWRPNLDCEPIWPHRNWVSAIKRFAAGHFLHEYHVYDPFTCKYALHSELLAFYMADTSGELIVNKSERIWIIAVYMHIVNAQKGFFFPKNEWISSKRTYSPWIKKWLNGIAFCWSRCSPTQINIRFNVTKS